MGDLISRQAVLDIIQNSILDLEYKSENAEMCSLIKQLPSVKPQEPKWIPVSERLPEDSGEYFVSIIDKYYDENYEDVGIAQFAHKKDYGIKESEWQIDETVIAWMPLPKPYKPQEISYTVEQDLNEYTGNIEIIEKKY